MTILKNGKIRNIEVRFHDRTVGRLSFSPDNLRCVFEYDRDWVGNGFSISPLEIPLKFGSFVAKAMPFEGGFGIFEDSLPDGYGRYMLHKALKCEGIDDNSLSVLDRLSIVGDNGMGALTYLPVNRLTANDIMDDLDLLQQKALEVLGERQDDDAELLLFNSGNSGGARPKVVYQDS